MLASQGLISADSVKPTGVVAPADALGEPKRMTTSDGERQESYECSGCGKVFSTERGRDSHVDQVHGRPYHSEQFLRREYIEKGRSSMDIAADFGVSYKAITDSLRRNGISVRTAEETHLEKSPDKLRDGEQLREWYHDDQLTTFEIAERVGVAQSTVSRWLSIHDIDTRPGTPSGEDHYAYKESPESIDYGDNWHQKSKQARERDEHTCQICGYEPDKDERALDVHHVQPIRTFESPEAANTLDNLITLCRQCHREWEGIPLRPEVV